MKFRCVDEFEQLSFDDSPIVSFQMSTDEVTFTFGGATIKAGNSQNGRFQDMYCGEITLTLLQAQMKRLVKDGMKYYDADGTLLNKYIPGLAVRADSSYENINKAEILVLKLNLVIILMDIGI